MHFKIHPFVYFSLLFFLRGSNAFNITSLLGQYPAFSTFNNYLTQAQLAGEINSHQTITVLVVSNDVISPLSGKPADILKKIMSLHVILDYYDTQKLQKLPNKTAILTTLFQTTGLANDHLGYLNATVISTTSVVISSAAQGQGATLGANLVKSIAAEPYNISVLQISTIIIPEGIDRPNTNNSSSSNSTSPSKPPTPAPARTPAKAPAPSQAKAPTGNAPASSPPRPAHAPRGSPPMPADTPAGSPPMPMDAPVGSPPMPADGPGADGPEADAPAAEDRPGGGTGVRVGLDVAITMALSTLCLMVMV